MLKEQETVTFPLLKKNFPFAPLTKVLIRRSDDRAWHIATFYICRPEQQRPFICEGGTYEQAIAYKGNEHLICKTFPEGYISVGDIIVCRDYKGCRVWKKCLLILDDSFPSSMEYPFMSKEYYPVSTHAHLIGTELPANTPAPTAKPPFKAFDRVLVRDNEKHVWIAALFDFYFADEKYKYKTVGGYSYRFCIPYEGNEELLGKKG